MRNWNKSYDLKIWKYEILMINLTKYVKENWKLQNTVESEGYLNTLEIELVQIVYFELNHWVKVICNPQINTFSALPTGTKLDRVAWCAESEQRRNIVFLF